MSKKFLDEIFEKEIVKLPEAEREPYRAARATAEGKTARRSRRRSSRNTRRPSRSTRSISTTRRSRSRSTDKMAEATKLRATKPAEGLVMALTEVKGKVPETKLFNRGDHDQPKQPLHAR